MCGQTGTYGPSCTRLSATRVPALSALPRSRVTRRSRTSSRAASPALIARATMPRISSRIV
eukprot:7927262-Lingulodinium_polyedra.AAC.1